MKMGKRSFKGEITLANVSIVLYLRSKRPVRNFWSMQNRRCLFLFLLSLVAGLFAPTSAFSWGERGHDLVTRVAARVLVARHAKDGKIVVPFIEKEHMLAHFSNVPDIVWRNVPDKEVVDLNSPTHYIDLEYLAAKPTFEGVPRDVKALEAQMKDLCAKATASYVCPEDSKGSPTISMVGSNPFRIRQLHDLMVQDFAKAKAALEAKNEKDFNAAVNDALLQGGLMAHFVGDLGNPEHGTRDYNGWEKGQGGLHNYFETEVVNAFPLGLDQEVYASALNKKPYARVEKFFPSKEKAKLNEDALAISFALVFDSYSRLAHLEALDKQHAMKKASSLANGMKVKAERKPAADVAPKFHDLAVERLATAADTLSRLWHLAWVKGGSPDLSTYGSYDYPVAPAFIKPDYL